MTTETLEAPTTQRTRSHDRPKIDDFHIPQPPSEVTVAWQAAEKIRTEWVDGDHDAPPHSLHDRIDDFVLSIERWVTAQGRSPAGTPLLFAAVDALIRAGRRHAEKKQMAASYRAVAPRGLRNEFWVAFSRVASALATFGELPTRPKTGSVKKLVKEGVSHAQVSKMWGITTQDVASILVGEMEEPDESAEVAEWRDRIMDVAIGGDATFISREADEIRRRRK